MVSRHGLTHPTTQWYDVVAMGRPYESTEIRRVWSTRQHTARRRALWGAHLHWLTSAGFVHGRRRGSIKEPLHPEHSTVGALQQEIRRTRRPFLHAGLTSSDIEDNARLWACAESVSILVAAAQTAARNIIAATACRSRCLGYTHWQPASWLTWRERGAAWAAPLLSLAGAAPQVRTHGFRGANGTGHTQEMLLGRPAPPFPWEKFGLVQPLAHQIQSSNWVEEARCCAWAGILASHCAKVALDIRFLCHTGEMTMSRSPGWVGSSAMPGKRNPIEAERICGLARLTLDGYATICAGLANNGMERTLDSQAPSKEALPRTFGIAHRCLLDTSGLMAAVHIDTHRCASILRKHKGAAEAERRVVALVRGGIPPRVAHTQVQAKIEETR